MYNYHIVYLEPESIPQERNRKKLIAVKNKLTKNHKVAVDDAIHNLPLKSCRPKRADPEEG